MKSFAFVAMAGAIQSPSGMAAPHAAHTIFRTSAMVESGAIDKTGVPWFKTWDEDARFILEKEPADRAHELFLLLGKSRDNSRSVEVTFDASAVRLNAATGTLDFPICAVRLEETVFTAARRCGDKAIEARKVSASPLLSVAVGWANAHLASSHDAVAFLDNAVGSKLPAALQTVALRARAEANETIAAEEEPESKASDQALVSSLADYAALAQQHPDDVEFRFGHARSLEALGDYDAAERLYDLILKQWPQERYRVTVRRSAVARLKGQYDRSLELLNSLVPEFAPNLGMKFYYHRGWTLTKLGRFDEAIADFTDGLKSQADYSSAYFGRGCAYASTGQLDAAIGDFQTANGLLRQLPGASADKLAQRDLKFSEAAIATLNHARESGASAPVPGLCDGFWGPYEKRRKRSPFLSVS